MSVKKGKYVVKYGPTKMLTAIAETPSKHLRVTAFDIPSGIASPSLVI